MEQTTEENDAPLLFLLPVLYKQILNSANPKEYGLTKSHIIILLSLSLHGTLNMTQIANYVHSNKEQTTRAVAFLVEEGYVLREHDETNRKVVFIQLTDKGKELIESWRRDQTSHLHDSFRENLTEEEQTEMQDAARTLIRLLKKLN